MIRLTMVIILQYKQIVKHFYISETSIMLYISSISIKIINKMLTPINKNKNPNGILIRHILSEGVLSCI